MISNAKVDFSKRGKRTPASFFTAEHPKHIVAFSTTIWEEQCVKVFVWVTLVTGRLARRQSPSLPPQLSSTPSQPRGPTAALREAYKLQNPYLSRPMHCTRKKSCTCVKPCVYASCYVLLACILSPGHFNAPELRFQVFMMWELWRFCPLFCGNRQTYKVIYRHF